MGVKGKEPTRGESDIGSEKRNENLWSSGIFGAS